MGNQTHTWDFSAAAELHEVLMVARRNLSSPATNSAGSERMTVRMLPAVRGTLRSVSQNLTGAGSVQGSRQSHRDTADVYAVCIQHACTISIILASVLQMRELRLRARVICSRTLSTYGEKGTGLIFKNPRGPIFLLLFVSYI